MAHVLLDASNSVAGEFANPQPGMAGYAEIDDADPRIAAFEARIAAKQQLAAALGAGFAITFTQSTALSGTYAIDQATQININSEITSFGLNNTFTNGQATRGWPTIDGSYPTFSIVQFKAFATAVALYVDQLNAAYASGGTWPNSSATING